MKKNKKGFTLIELLAVIIVLAIVCTIAVFTVANTLEQAKKDSFVVSVLQMLKEASDSLSSEYILSNVNQKIFDSEHGEYLTSGEGFNYRLKVYIDHGNVKGEYIIDDGKKYASEGLIPDEKPIVKYIEEVSIDDYLFIDEELIHTSNLTINQYNTIYENKKESLVDQEYISYEDFFAQGDGKRNDAYAIYYAHKLANELGKDVNISGKKIYYISHLPVIDGEIKSIEIKTNVNWNGSSIIIDDTDLEKKERSKDVFVVTNYIDIIEDKYSNLDTYKEHYVGIISNDKYYYREGNSTKKTNLSDYFYNDDSYTLKYEYKNADDLIAYKIGDELLLKNLNITTIPKKILNAEAIPTFRRFVINGSGIKISNFNHYLKDDDKITYYSQGFLAILESRDIEVSNSKFRSHVNKYTDSDKSVGGTYDIIIENSENVTLQNISYTCNSGEDIQDCYHKNIIDKNRWGIMGGNNNNNLKVINSIMNRVDSHLPTNNITIEDSILGYAGIQVTGKGNLNFENSSLDHTTSVIQLRQDYGSSWNGNININNVYFNPPAYVDAGNPILYYNYDNTKEFGVPTYFPNLEVTDLFLDEKASPKPDKQHGLVMMYNYANNVIENPVYKHIFNEGKFNFSNIRSMNYDKLRFIYVFLRPERLKNDYYENETNNKPTITITDNNINFYRFSKEIKMENYDSSQHVFNLIKDSSDYAYCTITTNEKPENEWYSGKLKLNLKVYCPKDESCTSGISRTSTQTSKDQSLTIEEEVKGVFNVYGYVTDSDGVTHKCIKLIKKK